MQSPITALRVNAMRSGGLLVGQGMLVLGVCIALVAMYLERPSSPGQVSGVVGVSLLGISALVTGVLQGRSLRAAAAAVKAGEAYSV